MSKRLRRFLRTIRRVERRTRRSGDVVRVRYRTHGGIVREVLS